MRLPTQTKSTLRWFGIFPAMIVVYFLTKLISNIGVERFVPGLAHDLAQSGGFGGHYIFGPLFVFTLELGAVGLSLIAAFHVIPRAREGSYRNIFILALPLVAFLFTAAVNLPGVIDTGIPGYIIRSILELVGFIAGSAIVFWGKFKEVRASTVTE